jgi:hypothetical protein
MIPLVSPRVLPALRALLATVFVSFVVVAYAGDREGWAG